MFRAPRHIPPLSVMLEDIHMHPSKVAKYLGVTERTLRTWRKSDAAPRPVLLTLYWETQWGRSHGDTDTANQAAWRVGQVRALERDNALLRAEISRLAALVAAADNTNSPRYREA